MVNGCDLTLPTQTQRSEQEYNDLTASNKQPVTPSSCRVEMARAANSQVFGPSAEVLKQSTNNCFSGDAIPGRCSLLAEIFCFLQSFKT